MIPSYNRFLTADEIVSLARRELRCIDWKNITENLMMGSTCGADVHADRSALYGISRPVARNEVIDYFMSHSWHDDAVAKWAALQDIVREFRRKHCRDPTFWLDKVCINQSHISDGLRLLPVNVMSCRNVLVLCGSTYTTRLWCIWELYTLFSFSGEEQALNRISIFPFGDDNETCIDRLKVFRTRESTCYDPNEKARLMKVIEAVGEDLFNDKMRRLGATLARQQNLKPVQVTQHADVVGAASSDHTRSEDQRQPEGLEGHSVPMPAAFNYPLRMSV